jgi:glycosyltransferase involved in cell wall biosynthesis
MRNSCGNLKVLHIWNTAGVGSIIAKYMDKFYGTSSWVIMRKCFDKYGFTTYGECWDYGGKLFTLRALWEARKYDIIHVHAFDRIVPILKILYRKPVVLHYHGTDIRGKWKERKKFWRWADILLYSTKDIEDRDTPPHAVWLPNPVDTELFYPRCKPEPQTAFHISYRADDIALEYAKRYGLKLFIHNREENPIPYTELATVLSKYEYYIDVKRDVDGRILHVPLSKTALEALACGCKVINWKGEEIHGLPFEHNAKYVAEKVWELYKNLLAD